MRQVFHIPAPPPSLPLSFARPWLAPLAGYSDLPFRLLCRELGAGVCETEMISAKGLVFKSPPTSELLKSTGIDSPLVIQLFGGEPESMATVLLSLREAGYRYFDCNMGCPVRKVLRQKAGAALMADTDLAMQIAKAMLNAASCPSEAPTAKVGFKLRLGISPGKETYLELGQRLEEAGASWLTLHPRHASQGYGGHAEWDHIAHLVQTVKIPVIASGDLMDAEAGHACIAMTGAATIMYGRGALRNPLIFTQHDSIAHTETTPAIDRKALARIIGRHIELTRIHCGNWRNFVKIRSFLPRYARFLPGTGELRQKLAACTTWAGLDECISNFLNTADNI